ncbi:MAG: GGDEF domain-containing protein [Treponema sp.]|jgi:diguanylate cyclase (GGDEF)-like protein|nr:GGDEF domain-containing protein [Treponema sp.]
MNNAIYITTALGSSLIIILIFINYIGKFNADIFQRKLLLALLCAALIAIITDSISRFFSGNSGRVIFSLLNMDIPLFLIAQNCTYYLSAVFIDYFAHRNIRRSKKFMAIIAVFLALYSISVIINMRFGYYFTISPDNRYMPGKLYPLRLFLSYGSGLLIIANMLFSFHDFKRLQFFLFSLFLVITGIGAVADIVFKEGSLAWPCFTAGILYMYFFIIQSDLMIDSLTGIGNRSGFNEFISKLSRQNTRLAYSIVMLDLDKFKDINDNLGHLEGDNALRDIAMIIKSCIRRSDFAARYGGDEFVIATEADYDIQRLMNRIQEAIDLQNKKRLRPYQIYISYGYDVFETKSGETIFDFLAKIDAKMYKQKDERKKRGIPSSVTADIAEEVE